MSAYLCVFKDCGLPANGPRNMCGRHYARVLRGVEAAPVEAGRTPSTAWMESAGCLDVDPEQFFPVGSTGPALAQIANAKAVCHRCPVRDACLSWALATGQDHGVFGGLTEDERRELKASHNADAGQLVTAGGAR